MELTELSYAIPKQFLKLTIVIATKTSREYDNEIRSAECNGEIPDLEWFNDSQPLTVSCAGPHGGVRARLVQ
jgi:hypothetical protein